MTKAMQKMSMGRGQPLAAADLMRRPAGHVQDLSVQNRLIRRNGASGTLLRVVVTVAFVMLFGCGSSSDTTSPNIETGAPASDWMATISDDRPISLLGIPGTHDTCTSSQDDWAYGGYVKTQNMGIVEQLEHGIRFLDIRCRLIGNGFAIHHDLVYLGLDFQEVINQCRSFLSAHPKETILMDVGHEYQDQSSTLSFHQVFLNYYNANRYLDDNRELWYLGTTIPTMGQVRGKIILMRSFDLDQGATAIGMGIATGGGNSAYSSCQFSTNPDQTVYVENLWTPDNCDNAYTEKENAIGSNIQRKELDHSPNHLYMTFTSGTLGSAWPPCYKTPRDFADNINPWFLSVVSAKSGPVGIVIMDFPGDDIIGLIIDSNFY